MKKRILLSLLITFLLVGMFSCNPLASASILIKHGSHGAAVQHVQKLLIEQGYLRGSADGIFGNLTEGAVKAFQQANGLKVDGVCGDSTYKLLSGGKEYTPPTPEEQGSTSGKKHTGTILYMSATAYSSQDPGNSPYTALGTRVRRGVIAVDPRVIPLRTHVFIPGYGDAIAEDVGGGIRGQHIDIAFETHAEAMRFGRRNVEVYIME